MLQVDFRAETLPVMELTETGLWIALGQAYGITMSRYRRGRGFGWTGRWKTLALVDPTQAITVLRWQTDKIIVQRRESEKTHG